MPLLRARAFDAARCTLGIHQSFPQILCRSFPSERPDRNRVSFLNQNPVRGFPCDVLANVQRPTHLRNATARQALNVQHRTLEKLLCGGEIFWHLRSAWTPGSRSIARFCFSILSSLSPSVSTWAERRKTSKTSRSAGVEFRGGQCSPHWWRLKQVPVHFSERPEKASATAITPIYSSPSARSSDAFSSAIFSSNRITTTKFSRSTST